MQAAAEEFRLETTREGEVVDVTQEVARLVAASGIRTGMALVFVELDVRPRDRTMSVHVVGAP